MRVPQHGGRDADGHDEHRAGGPGVRGRHRRRVARDREQLERLLRKALVQVVRPPARRLEPDAQLVAPTPRMAAVVRERRIHLDVRPHRVPAPERTARAVDAGLRVELGLEAAEQPVPDDEDAAEVAIEVDVVDRVVHPVVRRRAEPAVEPAEPADEPRVHPELVQQVDQRDDREHERRHAGDGHRQVEQPAGEPARAGLAQRGRQVVFLALVVHDVRGPEQRDLVAGAVQPVVQEVVGQQRAGPDRRRARAQLEQRGVRVHPLVDAEREQLREHADHLAHHAQADTVQGIRPRVRELPAAPADERLDRDEQEEDRRCQHDDLSVLHATLC